MKFKSITRQVGVSIVGLIFILAVLGMVGVFGLKVVPTYTEYLSVKKAITSAKTAGSTVREIQIAFDKQAEVGYITSVSGKDLEIVKNGPDVEVSFAYQKKIPLVGPASLLIDYEGSTARN